MTAITLTPVLPEATTVRALSALKRRSPERLEGVIDRLPVLEAALNRLLGHAQLLAEPRDLILRHVLSLLRSCARLPLAGVEPCFQRLNREDVGAFIISANMRRRNPTKGQQAMALAARRTP